MSRKRARKVQRKIERQRQLQLNLKEERRPTISRKEQKKLRQQEAAKALEIQLETILKTNLPNGLDYEKIKQELKEIYQKL